MDWMDAGLIVSVVLGCVAGMGLHHQVVHAC